MDPEQIRTAFKNIDTGGIDLGDVLADMWADEPFETVSLSVSDIESIAQRILTLNEIVSQNALIAQVGGDDE